jgi:hypothetical protein
VADKRCRSPLVTTGLDPVVHADVPSIQHRTEQLRGRIDCRVKPGNDAVILSPCLNLVIARSERDEAIQFPAQALDCFAIARNDDAKNRPRGA